MICCASESVSQVWTCCNREWLRLYLSTGIICPSFWYESMMLHVYTVLFPAFLRSQHCQHLSSGIHETTSPQNWKLKLVMFQIQRLLHDRCWMITTIFWQQTVPSVQQIEPCFAGGMVRLPWIPHRLLAVLSHHSAGAPNFFGPRVAKGADVVHWALCKISKEILRTG